MAVEAIGSVSLSLVRVPCAIRGAAVEVVGSKIREIAS